MKAMVLRKICNLDETADPLEMIEAPEPSLGEKDILVKVVVCGICHTELDEIEGRTPPAKFPVIPGHQIVGRVVKTGGRAGRFKPGDRVGIGWIASSCGTCGFCLQGEENLCEDFQATGRDVDGGYAEFTSIAEDYAHPVPDVFSDAEAAPLLCAGAIGYRSLRLTGMQDGENLGLMGFGSSAHIVLSLARHMYPQSGIFVFSRTKAERDFALALGARWAGDIGEDAPGRVHRIIDTTPAWLPVVASLQNLEKGGRLVINAIRKEERDKQALQTLDYARHLWMEKEIKSVANITRTDVGEFLALAARIPLKPEVEEFRLEDVNTALRELRERKIRGAKVLRIG
jgi:propanol-preferring alcohol dehydrogenase